MAESRKPAVATKSAPNLKEADKQKIVSTVNRLNLSEHPEWWTSLNMLSSRTEFDGLEVFDDEIVLEPGNAKKFRGNANVYVKLVYGGKDDESSMSDAFPLQFTGHFDGAKVVIEDVVVDTSSFHGEESND